MIKEWYKRWIKREKWRSQLHVENKNKMIVEAIEEATLELRNKYNFSMQVIEDTEYPYPSASFGLFNSPIGEEIFAGKVYWASSDSGRDQNTLIVVADINYKEEEFFHYRAFCAKENLDQLVIESVIRACLLELHKKIIGDKSDLKEVLSVLMDSKIQTKKLTEKLKDANKPHEPCSECRKEQDQ
jgi:hypothetical protein